MSTPQGDEYCVPVPPDNEAPESTSHGGFKIDFGDVALLNKVLIAGKVGEETASTSKPDEISTLLFPARKIGGLGETSIFTGARSLARRRLQKRLSSGAYIHPRIPWMKRWDTFIVGLLIYTAIVTPFEVSLLSMTTRVNWHFLVNRMVDLGFTIDLILSFFVAYQDTKTGLWVYDQPRIALHFLKGWFVVDILSVLPFDMIGLMDSWGHMWKLKMVRFIRLVRMTKLLRVLKMDRILSRVETTRYFGDSYDSAGPSRLYLGALYWSAMTMSTIGYGDIVADNPWEMMYATFSMVCGAFAYGYVIGAVSGIIATRDAKRNFFYSTMTDLNNFMEEICLPHPERKRLREYFKYRCMNSVDVNSYQSLLHIMSPGLRDEIASFTNSTWINSVKIFRGCPKRFITEIALAMELRTYPPAEVVVMRGSYLKELFIVKKGVLVVSGRILTSGKVFGEETIYKECIAAFSARSMTFSDVLREEILAYSKAYRNLMCELQGAIAVGTGLLAVVGSDDEEQDIPENELKKPPINSRVLHYSIRLRRLLRQTLYAGDTGQVRMQFSAAVMKVPRYSSAPSLALLRQHAMASRIQRAWRHYVLDLSISLALQRLLMFFSPTPSGVVHRWSLAMMNGLAQLQLTRLGATQRKNPPSRRKRLTTLGTPPTMNFRPGAKFDTVPASYPH
ncbi:hypothetical protein BSKO_13934 [Bryopsis sp. KO-2023]|nr:hypothetical protein BSKO_13934 [Bryopsis sp. KO-2023]